MGGVGDIAALGAAYLLGCLNTGYYLVRAQTNRDLRETGSGTAGARNVGRVLGRRGFIVTFAGDFVKGVAAIYLARTLKASDATLAWVVFAVAIGHVWPVQLRFKGGKGVACTLGALAALNFWLFLAMLAVTTVGLAVSRRLQASGLAASVFMPGIGWLLKMPAPQVAGLGAVSALILWSHRSNVRKLIEEARQQPRGRDSARGGV
jgi:glycerol-3-phosphate acyltransferase PlsY